MPLCGRLANPFATAGGRRFTIAEAKSFGVANRLAGSLSDSDESSISSSLGGAAVPATSSGKLSPKECLNATAMPEAHRQSEGNNGHREQRDIVDERLGSSLNASILRRASPAENEAPAVTTARRSAYAPAATFRRIEQGTAAAP